MSFAQDFVSDTVNGIFVTRKFDEFGFGSHYEYNFYLKLEEKSPFEIHSCSVKENLPHFMDYTTDIHNGTTYPHFMNGNQLQFRWNQFKDSLTLSYRLITLVQYGRNDQVNGQLVCTIQDERFRNTIVKIDLPQTVFRSKVRLEKVD
ncbi:MAG: hypothetical protein MRY83_14430 [Flavobacteriales bacterium]|nr:hypothetical protein [Flavobacteriales bacterium]